MSKNSNFIFDKMITKDNITLQVKKNYKIKLEKNIVLNYTEIPWLYILNNSYNIKY